MISKINKFLQSVAQFAQLFRNIAISLQILQSIAKLLQFIV